MRPTIVSTLSALSNVGNVDVRVRLNPQLFPVEVCQETAARHGDVLSVDAAAELTVRAVGHDSWHALREFMQDLLAAALRAE
jgi:hypothetical protein